MRRTVASVQRGARARGKRGDGHDHPRPVRDHPPCGQARGQEVRRRVGRDRQRELLGVQLGQRARPGSSRIRDADRVERDVDAARLLDHRLQMPVHRLLVERVDLGRLGGAAGGDDVLGDRFDRCPEAPGEKDARPPRPRRRARPRRRSRLRLRRSPRPCPSASSLVPFCAVGGHPRPLRELRPAAETRPRGGCRSPSAGVRIVRAVDDAETVTPGNWAPAGRPVRPLAGVEVKVMTAGRAGRADRRTRWNAMKPRIQCVPRRSESPVSVRPAGVGSGTKFSA